MIKRVVIIHGWGGNPQEGWFPWIKKELEKCGVEVLVPPMPNPETPKISEWVPFLYEQVGEPDGNTFLIGHSIGCQTILRYLEKVKNKVGGAIFVAGWFELKGLSEEEKAIARPWVERPVDFEKVKQNLSKVIAFFSNNDPFVDLELNRKIFQDNLGAEIKIEDKKGHFSGEDNMTEFPAVLEEAMKMMNISPIGSRAIEENADYKI